MFFHHRSLLVPIYRLSSARLFILRVVCIRASGKCLLVPFVFLGKCLVVLPVDTRDSGNSRQIPVTGMDTGMSVCIVCIAAINGVLE